MLVTNSFDLWQRDGFFSAAEEVQESADILESAYRTWVRQKKGGISSNVLDELRREVQTALGTAKWQLEEFERAVGLSYGNCRDHNKIARHQQFVVAIESQISRIEDTLKETLNEEGKQPFRWVNLDENERDDLAMFLSGSSGTFSKSARDKIAKPSTDSAEENLCNNGLDCGACSSSCSMESSNRTKGSATLRDDIVIDLGHLSSDVNCESERTRGAKRTQVSPNYGLLKVVIPDDDDHMRTLASTIEATPKEKGSKSSSLLKLRVINCINKVS
ncbi:Syntaxin-61 [Bienertia sinuspersici]